MGSTNLVIIQGNLGRDPEIMYTQANDAVARLSVATTESWKDKATGEWQEKTEWHRVKAWRYLAEKAEKLRKGDQVMVQGKLETNKWTDKQGQDKYTTEIIASVLYKAGRDGQGKPDGVDETGHFNPPPMPKEDKHPAASPNAKEVDWDDDLPF